jgi:hypothetical protein
MDDQVNTPMSPLPSEPTSFLQVWMNALTKPSEQTFAKIANLPNTKASVAYSWVFLTSLVQIFFLSLVQGTIVRQALQQQGFDIGVLGNGIEATLITSICGAPIFAAASVAFFAIVVAIIQWIARMFGGRGSFNQMAYASAAIAAPFALIRTVLALLAAIPYVGFCFGWIGVLALLYVVILQVIAVKGVNQLGWGQAAGSFVLPFIMLCCCFSVGLIGVMQLIAPRIGDHLAP